MRWPPGRTWCCTAPTPAQWRCSRTRRCRPLCPLSGRVNSQGAASRTPCCISSTPSTPTCTVNCFTQSRLAPSFPVSQGSAAEHRRSHARAAGDVPTAPRPPWNNLTPSASIPEVVPAILPHLPGAQQPTEPARRRDGLDRDCQQGKPETFQRHRTTILVQRERTACPPPTPHITAARRADRHR
jgi:hypothetical protein